MTISDLTVSIEAQQVLDNAELIYSAQQIEQAINQLASEINKQLTGFEEPILVLPIMNGGLILSGHLLTRLQFPLKVDYLHATRYRDTTRGNELLWKVKPSQSLKGRTLLIIDDIFDEGFTLEAVMAFCEEQEVAQAYTAVLIEKDHPRVKADISCDFIGMRVDDKYVFGFGMDYKGYHRNLNAIYAVNEEGEKG